MFKHRVWQIEHQAVGKMGGTGNSSSPGASGGGVVTGCDGVSGPGFAGMDGLKSGSEGF